MKIMIIISALFFSVTGLAAQAVAKKIGNTKSQLDSTNNTLNSTSNTINGTSVAITNTANAMKNLANTFGFHKSNKKKGEEVVKDSLAGLTPVTVSISGIDYEKLELTEDSIQTIPGVKSVDMNYNANGSTVNVLYNGKPSQLWHCLSPAVKSMFEVQSQDATSIAVQYKK